MMTIFVPAHRFRLFCLMVVVVLFGGLSCRAEPVDATLRILLHRHIETYNLQGGGELPDELRNMVRDYYYWSEEGYRLLRIETNLMSAPIQYKGSDAFVLYERRPSNIEGEPYAYIPRMGCRLPSRLGASFLLVAPEQAVDESRPLRLHVLPIDPEAVPEGNMLAFNLGGRTLRMVTASGPLSVEPNQSALLKITGGASRQFKVLAAVGEKDGYVLVYRRSLFLSNNSRALCIFYPTNKLMDRWNSRLIPIQ